MIEKYRNTYNNSEKQLLRVNRLNSHANKKLENGFLCRIEWGDSTTELKFEAVT